MDTVKRNLFLAIFFSLLIWIVDAALDSLLFFGKPFLDSLLLDPGPHEWYIRLMILGIFLLFWLFNRDSLHRLQREKQKLLEKEEELEKALLREKEALEEAHSTNEELEASYEQIEASNQQLEESEQQLHAYNQVLRQETEKFENAFLQSSLPIFLWDCNHLIKEWNQACERAFGWSRKEAVGKDWIHLLVAQKEVPDVQKMAKIICGGTSLHIRHKAHPREGNTLTFEWDNALTFDSSGKPATVVSIGRDTSLLEKVQDELRKEWANKQTLLSGMPDLIVQVDPDFHVEWINPAWESRSGLASPTFLGKQCFRVRFDREKPCEGCPLPEAKATKKPQSRQMLSSDGKTVWLARAIPFFDQEGHLEKLVNISTDITHLIPDKKPL